MVDDYLMYNITYLPIRLPDKFNDFKLSTDCRPSEILQMSSAASS